MIADTTEEFQFFADFFNFSEKNRKEQESFAVYKSRYNEQI